MTGKQNAVFWLGAALIATVFFFGGQFHDIWTIIKTKTPIPQAVSGSGNKQPHPKPHPKPEPSPHPPGGA
jgi:hypothetical protein